MPVHPPYNKQMKDWAPGALSNIQIEYLINEGIIQGIDPPQADSKLRDFGIDYSSFDLHITNPCYRLEGCVKPFREPYDPKVLREDSKQPEAAQYVLERNNTYVFPIKERIRIPSGDYSRNNLWGIATGKSSIGRVDVLVRLIADGMDEYDRFHALRADGGLFLEIIPITFRVKVQPGTALSQLRLYWGNPQISRIGNDEIRFRNFLRNVEVDDNKDHTALTVNFEPSASIVSGVKAIALMAQKNKEEPVPLWLDDPNNPDEPVDSMEFWEAIKPRTYPQYGPGDSLKLGIDKFYILRSKEKICLPENVAVYCKAMDEALGEMRIHYAGFVHPYFGESRTDGQLGTNLIFEVRGHNMDIFLTHGETLAKSEFYRMSEPARYEPGNEAYGEQELKLSKFFKEWE